jgi:CheY-like chemotaxis protein
MEGGGELLIVNGSPKDLKGLAQLFATAGLIVSPAADTDAARRMIETKYFTVILIDSIVGPEPAIKFLEWVRKTAPTTEVIITTDDPSFDVASNFFRAGALDVVPKKREQVDYLKNRVVEAAHGQKMVNASSQLLTEARGVLEEFLGVLLDIARKSLPDNGGEEIPFDYQVCVVDPEELVAADLAAISNEFEITHCLSNGEALDKVATGRFLLLIAPLESDLPGRMVARTALKNRPEMDAWLYTGRPGEGQVIPVEVGGIEGRPQPFPDVQTFCTGVLKRKARAAAMARERRALDVIKSQNVGIIRRYGSLREKIDSALRAAQND